MEECSDCLVEQASTYLGAPYSEKTLSCTSLHRRVRSKSKSMERSQRRTANPPGDVQKVTENKQTRLTDGQ